MRRWIAIIAAALLLLAVADVVAWQVLTARMRLAWDDFVAQHRAAGWQIAAGTPVAGGFPLVARLRITDVEMAHDSKPFPGGISYGAETLDLEVPFTAPTHFVIRPQGAMHLRVGTLPDTDFTATSMVLRGALAGGAADLSGTGLQIATSVGPVGIGTLTSSLITQSGDLTVAANAIAMPEGSRATVIANTLDHAGFDVTLHNRVLTIRAVTLNWGKLAVTGQGQFQPDGQLQPAGEAQVQLFGGPETVDDLSRAGQLPPQTAQNVKLILGLLQRQGPDGKPMVQVPIKVVNRTLTVGGFPVMRLPEVQLPIAAAQTPQ